MVQYFSVPVMDVPQYIGPVAVDLKKRPKMELLGQPMPGGVAEQVSRVVQVQLFENARAVG
jgi:hypothetical protein